MAEINKITIEEAADGVATCDCTEFDWGEVMPHGKPEPLCDDCGRWDSRLVGGRCEQCRTLRPAVKRGSR